MNTKSIDTITTVNSPPRSQTEPDRRLEILSEIYQTIGLARHAARQAAWADLVSLFESTVTIHPEEGSARSPDSALAGPAGCLVIAALDTVYLIVGHAILAGLIVTTTILPVLLAGNRLSASAEWP